MKVYTDGSTVVNVLHGCPPLVSNMFLVSATQGDTSKCHVRHLLIVAAHGEADAIERVKWNARYVIQRIKARCTKDQFEEHEIREVSITDSLGARRVSEQLEKMQEIDEPTEADAFDMRDLRLRLKELQNGKVVGKESEFSRRASRMNYLLSENTSFKAERIDGDRAIPVGYFDDSRDVSSL